jgi:hypothetical protein
MRKGVLSDVAVKLNYPEFFPLDIGSGESFHTVHLETHNFKGIKQSREKKLRQTHGRTPLYDMQNYSQFGAPIRNKEAQYASIMNYRKNIGSPNFTSNLELGYKMRNNAGTSPLVPHTPTATEIANIANSPSASLTLGYRALKSSSAPVYHSKTVSGTKHAGQYTKKQQHFLVGLGLKGDEYLELLETLHTGKPQSNEALIRKLEKEYRDDPEALSIIKKAYTTAGAIGIAVGEPIEEVVEEGSKEPEEIFNPLQ